jgi:hypothetical protein
MKQKRKSTSLSSKPAPVAATAPAAKVSLRQIEQEVLAEGREWTRQRLQQRLQQLADKHGEISPLKPKKD